MKKKFQTIRELICLLKGHRYAIKWEKNSRMGEGEMVGMGDLTQPCFRCGRFAEDPRIDIEKMFWALSDRLREVEKILNERKQS